MGKRAKTGVGPKVSLTQLDSPPEGKPVLRVRNISTIGLDIPLADHPDLILKVQEEQVVGAEWAKARGLRDAVGKGLLETEWVEAGYSPRYLPDPDQAPPDARPESPTERAFALEIAYGAADTALEKIAFEKKDETDAVDATYMKRTFAPILRLALWLERQVQNRSEVLRALDKRIDEIRAL